MENTRRRRIPDCFISASYGSDKEAGTSQPYSSQTNCLSLQKSRGQNVLSYAKMECRGGTAVSPEHAPMIPLFSSFELYIYDDRYAEFNAILIIQLGENTIHERNKYKNADKNRKH